MGGCYRGTVTGNLDFLLSNKLVTEHRWKEVWWEFHHLSALQLE